MSISVPDDERDDARRRVEQRIHVVRVDERHDDEHHRRHRGDDPARQPALGGQGPDHAPQLHALTDRLGEPVHDLGGVAAGLALQRDDERDALEVLALHPLGDAVQRRLERHAELLVGEHAAELAARRLRRVLDDDRQRAEERVPGAHRRRDDLQVVRQLVVEQASLAADLRPQEQPEPERQRDGEQRGPGRVGSVREQVAEEQRRHDRPEDDGAGGEVDPGELEAARELGPAARALGRGPVALAEDALDERRAPRLLVRRVRRGDEALDARAHAAAGRQQRHDRQPEEQRAREADDERAERGVDERLVVGRELRRREALDRLGACSRCLPRRGDPFTRAATRTFAPSGCCER